MAECNVNILLAQAAAGKFDCLSKRELQIIILQLLCEILAVAGGGTSPGGGVDRVFSGSGPPNIALLPISGAAIYKDETSPGNPVYWGYGGAWH